MNVASVKKSENTDKAKFIKFTVVCHIMFILNVALIKCVLWKFISPDETKTFPQKGNVYFLKKLSLL